MFTLKKMVQQKWGQTLMALRMAGDAPTSGWGWLIGGFVLMATFVLSLGLRGGGGIGVGGDVDF